MKRLNTNLLLLIAMLLAATSQSLSAQGTNPPPERLRLPSAAALALMNNPALRAHGFELQAADARRLQARLRPNPALSVEVEDVLGTGDYEGVQQAQTTLQLSQLIELGGKRQSRGEVAESLQRQKLAEMELARVEVLAAVADQFIHVVGDQLEANLAREATKLAEETLELAKRRVAAGTASPIEEKRANILLSRARIAEEHAEHELLVANRKLAALWGATNATFTEVEADLFARATVPSFDELTKRINRSPELKRWATEKTIRDAEIKLADARRRPDILASAGIRQYAGPDDIGFVFQFSLPLAISDRQQGARAEARALRDKTIAEEVNAEVRLRTALFAMSQELLHAATELDALEREMLPDAEAMLQLAHQGIERARFSQLELLDAQRTLLELRLQRIESAVAYHQFVIQIEKLLGEALSPQSAQSENAPELGLAK